MPDTPPAELPVPCATDAIMLDGWMCVPDGEGTKWVRHYPPYPVASPLPLSSVGKSGCGGGQCAKVKLLETAVSLKWSPEQVVTVAKALGLK